MPSSPPTHTLAATLSRQLICSFGSSWRVARLTPLALAARRAASVRSRTDAKAWPSAGLAFGARLRLFSITMTRPVTTTPNVEPERKAEPALTQHEPPPDDTPLTNAELVQLRIRVIALENLVIALLADAPDTQLALARGMAAYISPRAGFTPHPITLRAADEMLSLVNRASRYLHP